MPEVGGYAAIVGGVLLLPSAFWSAFFAADGWLPVAFVVLSVIGTVLVTASVLWLYPLIVSEGGAEGSLWASLGAAVVLLSLVSLVVYGVMSLSGAESGRLYLAVSVLALWVRPVGVALFAFALVRSDILFGRALLLFLVSFLELPLLGQLGSGGLWETLLFGVPGLQTGVPGAVAWISFGYSLLLLGGLSERLNNREDPDGPAFGSSIRRP